MIFLDFFVGFHDLFPKRMLDFSIVGLALIPIVGHRIGGITMELGWVDDDLFKISMS